MALNLDPITGLPSDFLAPDLYQIPLSSRPQLAPEWAPDHLPPNALHPDNMPSFFATIQAQNQLNPELPQACTTDGAGNLNVNVKAGGGGGGGGGVVPRQYVNDVGGGAMGGSGTFSGGTLGIWLSNPPTAVVSAHLQFVVTSVVAGQTGQVLLYLSNPDKSIEVPLLYYIVGHDTTVYGDGRYIFERVFDPPIDVAGTFGAGVVPVLEFLGVECSWGGAYRFTGIV